tara:strand:+ start:327 stop:644 length:318 start_codon:yes stop_codon:yes gene_type:complete
MKQDKYDELLYEEPNGFIGLTWNKELNVYMMHLDCDAWSKTEFKRYLKIFKRVCIELRERGITEVYGLAKDKKAIKFNRMFGATTTGHLIQDETGSLNALIKMET